MKKWIIRGALVVVVLLVAAALVAGSYIDSIVKSSVEKVGPMLTKVEVKLDAVNLSMLSGGGSIKGLLVGNPEGYKSPSAIKVGNATLALAPRSIFADKVIIRTIHVEAPEITFETDFKGNNLSKILQNLEEVTGPSDDSPGKKLQVDDFLISGTKMSVALTSLGGKSITVPLPDIHLKSLGQGPEGITAASLLKQVLGELEKNAVRGASTAAQSLGADAAKTATGAADQVKKGIGGLLKR